MYITDIAPLFIYLMKIGIGKRGGGENASGSPETGAAAAHAQC
jgi:hypothetical protein